MSHITLSHSRNLRKHQTDAERKLWSVLRNRSLNGSKFRRQYVFNSYILDFYCHEYMLAIEADGGQHYEGLILQKDAARKEALAAAGVTLLRFSNRDILQHIESVCAAILMYTQAHPPHLASPRRGEE